MDLTFQVPMQYCSLQHSDLASITSHIHNWVLFLLWVHLFILSGGISPLISSSILGTYQPGEFLFQYPIILPFHIVHGVLKGSGHPHPNPVEFPFLSSVNFCAINIFPFPFLIQMLVQVGGSWLALAMSQYVDIDPGVLALL